MPFLSEDSWINGQTTTHDLHELEDCAIAIHASYFLGYLLDTDPSREPLLSALGGLTGINHHIELNLDLFEKHKIVPLFIFDGQSIIGQDEVSVGRGRTANLRTSEAWKLYAQSHAEQAVLAFGANPGAFSLRNLYPLLQRLLKQRGLHFLVPPYNACAQLAYLEMVDSDQCAGVMGPQELLLYPIRDSVIRGIDWDTGTVTAISKKRVMRALGVSESMLIDSLLMTGTSFLYPFPALLDTSIYTAPFTLLDAVNILRTADRSVANACASFHDVLHPSDPMWLDKYRKARMAVHHFIYIAESGEVCVNDYDSLTKDNHEYLGLQLPAELFHYLNTGLIGPRNLNSITHGQIIVQPTLDGESLQQYKKLMTEDILPLKEQALGLIIPRIHRGIGHKNITMRVWFDPAFAHVIDPGSSQSLLSAKVGSWDVKEADRRRFFPADFTGPIYFEVVALANSAFAETTKAKNKIIRGINSTDMVVSVTVWRFLHVRGYVNDNHELTRWGNALATTLLALKDANYANEDRPEVPGIEEAALLAFELLKFGLLNGKKESTSDTAEENPKPGDQASVIIISKCATLLKLQHQYYGYTGPLIKDLLCFRTLSSAVREADRDLIEALVASMFMYGQSKRERDDCLEISHRLPFLREPDIALGIAVRTFFEGDDVSHGKEARAARLAKFPSTFVPLAENLVQDFRICVDFVLALNLGVQTLDTQEMTASDKAYWAEAQAYLEARPF